jgi:hypothetical protein
MTGFGLTAMALGRHVPPEGVVLGYIHASAACRRVPLLCRGGGPRFCVAYLCFLDTSSPWFTGVVTTLADALPPFFVAGGCLAALSIALADALPPCFSVVRMLCCSLLQRMLGRCGCAAPWSSSADTLPLWLCCSLVVSDGCFAAVVVLLFGRLRRLLRCRAGAPGWMHCHPSLRDCLARRTWCCRLLSRFSSAIRFGGLSGVFPLCVCFSCWLVWFRAMSVIRFLLNETRAKARSRKKCVTFILCKDFKCALDLEISLDSPIHSSQNIIGVE